MLLQKNENLDTKVLTIDNYVDSPNQKVCFSTRVALKTAKHWFALQEPKQKVFPRQSTDEASNIRVGLA